MFNPRAEMNEYRAKQEYFLSRSAPEEVFLQDRPSGMIVDAELSVDKITVAENTVTVWAKPQHRLHPEVLRRAFRRIRRKDHLNKTLVSLLLLMWLVILAATVVNGSRDAALFLLVSSAFFLSLAIPLLLIDPLLTRKEWAAETKRKVAEFQFRHRTSAGLAAEALRHDPRASLKALRVLSEPEGTDIARKTAANIVGRLVEAQRYEEELERAAELAEKEALASFESAAGTPMKQLADEEEMTLLDYKLRASGK